MKYTVVVALFLGNAAARHHHHKIHERNLLGMRADPAAEGEEAKWEVRGEKQWQQWAGDQTTYADGQTTTANTRLPYASTLQLEDSPGWAVRGEKFTQDFSQGLVDYEDHQADTANTRIPYASTLQLEDSPGWAVRGEKFTQDFS